MFRFSSLFYFIAFLPLLLVSLSVPIAKHIFLFRLTAHDTTIFSSGVTGTATFGVWGYCVSSIDLSIAGIHHSTPAKCSKARLGFNFDSTLASALHVSGSENLINHTLTGVLVLHPIACILTFVAFVASVLTLKRRPDGSARVPPKLVLGIAIFAAILTTIVFLIDIGLVAVIRHRLNSTSNGHLTLSWGNAVWMSLGATFALWVANAIALSHVFVLRRKARNTATDLDDPEDVLTTTG